MTEKNSKRKIKNSKTGKSYQKAKGFNQSINQSIHQKSIIQSIKNQ
jgi:hypothetical protein